MTLQLGPFWTLANVLSLARVALAAPVAVLILRGANVWLIIGLCMLAGATDWFDGQIARWNNSVTGWGKILDPVADKVAVLVTGSALVVKGLLPLWLIALIVIRDVLIVAGSAVISREVEEVQASMWTGKVAVTAVAATIIAAVLRTSGPVMQICLWTTAALMTLSFVQYLIRFLKLRTRAAHC